MATLLYTGTHGTDDPTRASMPFHLAIGAIEAGHRAQILLIGDATALMSAGVAKEIKGVATPPLTELIGKAVAGGAQIFV